MSNELHRSTRPAAALGIVDLRQMGLNASLCDIVPHLAYGLATAISYDVLAGRCPGRGNRVSV